MSHRREQADGAQPPIEGNGFLAPVMTHDQTLLAVAFSCSASKRTLDLIQRVREVSGKPVGFKVVIGAYLADPEIIASTRETGGVLPTSVLIHDALDHLISGFAPSGHRAEAMALAQLAERAVSRQRSASSRCMAEVFVFCGLHIMGEPRPISVNGQVADYQ
ncbi:hypothetical protein [Thiocystis violacea]|uniref:hypothetical protein n=1 Tax=Thiocystis violacea TaxID=13725 RepID=UPI001906E1E7|nr:hypothetical protein [Thiocystis violacea]MBK1716092.1 hypothetical protein [Thiocystis violacea]